jgi:3-hydroxybutyryl-CoA dehydrogenase
MVQRVGIIGAGQMGAGISHVCALSGLDVHLFDVQESALSAAVSSIERNLVRQASRGKVADADVKVAMARISTGQDYAAFADSDLVIEAATENEAVKREILKALVPHLSATALIATNTSSISITRLAAVTDRPGKFIGMHFMNPVPIMQLVELISRLTRIHSWW